MSSNLRGLPEKRSKTEAYMGTKGRKNVKKPKKQLQALEEKAQKAEPKKR